MTLFSLPGRVVLLFWQSGLFSGIFSCLYSGKGFALILCNASSTEEEIQDLRRSEKRNVIYILVIIKRISGIRGWDVK